MWELGVDWGIFLGLRAVIEKKVVLLEIDFNHVLTVTDCKEKEN